MLVTCFSMDSVRVFSPYFLPARKTEYQCLLCEWRLGEGLGERFRLRQWADTRLMPSMSLHLKCNPACFGLRCLFDLAGRNCTAGCHLWKQDIFMLHSLFTLHLLDNLSHFCLLQINFFFSLFFPFYMLCILQSFLNLVFLSAMDLFRIKFKMGFRTQNKHLLYFLFLDLFLFCFLSFLSAIIFGFRQAVCSDRQAQWTSDIRGA